MRAWGSWRQFLAKRRPSIRSKDPPNGALRLSFRTDGSVLAVHLGMVASEAVYIVVVGEDGQVRAKRYVECERVAEWLQRNGPSADRCEVYTDAPEKGGQRVAVLHRNPQHDWLPTPPR
jgi:hypothetical protein